MSEEHSWWGLASEPWTQGQLGKPKFKGGNAVKAKVVKMEDPTKGQAAVPIAKIDVTGSSKPVHEMVLENQRLAEWIQHLLLTGDDAINWKAELQAAYQKDQQIKTGSKALRAGAISYTVSEIGVGMDKLFQAVLYLDGNKFAGDAKELAKKAEHSAAKKAIQKLYPHHDVVTGYVRSKHGAAVKRKFGDFHQPQQQQETVTESQQKQQAKGMLVQGLQRIFQRTVAPDDIIYEVEGEQGNFVATGTISAMGYTFTGQPQKSKKDAERSAAEVALDALRFQIEAAEVVSKERKKQMNQESLAKFKAKINGNAQLVNSLQP